MSELISNFVKKFKPGKNLIKPDEKILDFGKKMLPPEIIELWTIFGFGEYGDGLIKVIDPRNYMDSLYTWIGEQNFNKIPILMSAFGDIFYYRKLDSDENDVCLLDIHYGKIDVCTYSYKDFFDKYILNDKVIDIILRRKLYDESVRKFGKLEYNEIYFFVPALILGGAEAINYIAKGDASVHHQILLQLH